MLSAPRKQSRTVAEALDEVDTILSGTDLNGLPQSVNGGDSLVAFVGDTLSSEPTSKSLFSNYLVSPSYFVNTDDMLLVKLLSAKGEPFYLLDPTKISRPLVCGSTEVFLVPYNADSACADECDGLPMLHVVPDCVARSLFSQALRTVSTAKYFAGLVFVSSVGIQFYYRRSIAAGETASLADPEIISSVYRVAADSEGNIDERDVRGAVTCDYPVPYLLVDQEVFAEGINTCSIVESLPHANAALIDTLCRLEYGTLHGAEIFPDKLATTLEEFMGQHSNVIRGLLEAQLGGSKCDDAFVRRQRKSEIDTMVRLMMREVELVGDLKRTIEELQYVQSALETCPPVSHSVPAVLAEDSCQSKNLLRDSTHSRRLGGTVDVEASPMAEDASSFDSCEEETCPQTESRRSQSECGSENSCSGESEEDEGEDPLTNPIVIMTKEEQERRAKAVIGDEGKVDNLDLLLREPVTGRSSSWIANSELLYSPSSSSGSDC